MDKLVQTASLHGLTDESRANINAAPISLMLSRGRQQEGSHESDNFELHQFSDGTREDDEDIHPESDTACLRKHRLKDDDDENSIDDHGLVKGILAQIRDIMSRSALLRSVSSRGEAGYYGALRADEQSSVDNNDDAVSKLDRRKASSNTIQRNGSRQNPDVRRRRRSCSGSGSRSRGDRNLGLRASSPMFFAEPAIAGHHGGKVGGLPVDINDVHDRSGNVEVSTSGDDDDEEDPPDNSPYPQVLASVAATDNISASINTPRMWTLSLLCAFLGSATNLFFSLRYPSVAITPVIALVVVHPLGRVWDSLLKFEGDPPEQYEYGLKMPRTEDSHAGEKWTRRLRLWLSQGEWNEKEHACVYISSNVAFGFAFATDVIVEQHKFYKQDVTMTYQVLLTVSTQILGYSFAGLTRRYLVRPPSMIWPGILMASAMFTTIHSSENHVANGWKVTRLKFFFTVFSIAFVWYFVPGLLMPALSYFNVITWFAPENVVLANLVRYLSPECCAND